MIKECLLEVVNSTLDLGDVRKSKLKKIIESYEEEQISYQLQTYNGLMMDDIKIQYSNGIGFRCTNDERVGRLPMCNIIQKILNNKLQEL
jgi:hypothetical protein